MMHKYCPSCGSMDMKTLHTGIEECGRCHFRGDFREGSMDEINSFRKSMKGVAPNPALQKEQQPASELKKKLNSLKGKKTDDFEIL